VDNSGCKPKLCNILRDLQGPALRPVCEQRGAKIDDPAGGRSVPALLLCRLTVHRPKERSLLGKDRSHAREISVSACSFQISVQLSAANNELGRAHVVLQHENHPA
jgi:hypothetical protein